MAEVRDEEQTVLGLAVAVAGAIRAPGVSGEETKAEATLEKAVAPRARILTRGRIV